MINKLEYLHNSGKLPDKYYYQLAGMPAEEALNQQHRILIKEIKPEDTEALQGYLTEEAQKAIEIALNRILKDF